MIKKIEHACLIRERKVRDFFNLYNIEVVKSWDKFVLFVGFDYNKQMVKFLVIVLTIIICKIMIHRLIRQYKFMLIFT